MCGCNKNKVYRVTFNDGSPSKDFTDQRDAQRAAEGGKGIVRHVTR